MLVLTRRQNESIVIDGGIRVTVVSIHGGRVRLAIEAPKSVRVDREEVRERLDHEEIEDQDFSTTPVARL